MVYGRSTGPAVTVWAVPERRGAGRSWIGRSVIGLYGRGLYEGGLYGGGPYGRGLYGAVPGGRDLVVLAWRVP